MIDSVQIVRRQGSPPLLLKRGWRFFDAKVVYYLVRDILLYIVLPLWLAWDGWAGGVEVERQSACDGALQ